MHVAIAWKSGLRSAGFWLVLVLGLLLMTASWLAGAFSLRQPLVVALDVGISGIRFVSVLLVLYWLQEVLAKDIDKRTVYFVLAYPVSRTRYLVGRYVGVMSMAAVAVLLFGLLLWGMVGFASWGYEHSSQPFLDGRFLWVLLGIWLDAGVVAAFSTWVIAVAETPFIAVVMGFFFTLAGRTLGPVIEYLTRPQAADAETVAHFLPIMQRAQWLLPDLSRLDWRSGVLYDVWPSVQLMQSAILMAVGFVTVLLGAAWWSFNKREFH